MFKHNIEFTVHFIYNRTRFDSIFIRIIAQSNFAIIEIFNNFTNTF